MKAIVADYFSEIIGSVLPLLARTTTFDAARVKCQDCNTATSCEIANLLREVHPEYRGPLCGSRKIATGEHLFRAGDKLDAVYVVKSGVIKRYFHDNSGDERVAGFSRLRQVLGIEALLHGTASIAAVALEDANVCRIPLAALASIPDKLWSTWLMSRVWDEQKRERLLQLISAGMWQPQARVAYFLLEQATGHGECGYAARSFKLLIPCQEIAAYLDLNLGTLFRVISNLQQEGAVLLEREILTILEPKKLLALASIDTVTADDIELAAHTVSPYWTSRQTMAMARETVPVREQTSAGAAPVQ